MQQTSVFRARVETDNLGLKVLTMALTLTAITATTNLISYFLKTNEIEQGFTLNPCGEVRSKEYSTGEYLFWGIGEDIACSYYRG